MSYTSVFMRRENKYLLTTSQYNNLLSELNGELILDDYPQYTICNIYFDTDDYSVIRKSLEKPEFKQKLRLRSYGIPTLNDNVFFELKKKFKGIVYKRRIKLKYSEFLDFLENGQLKDDNLIAEEIATYCNVNGVKPKEYVAYDRVAYKSKSQVDLRITFDNNLRFRSEKVMFENGDYGKSLLYDGHLLMEAKAIYSFPLELAKLFSDLNIMPISYSKYGKAYMTELQDKLIQRR